VEDSPAEGISVIMRKQNDCEYEGKVFVRRRKREGDGSNKDLKCNVWYTM
jgi:hypothetical protein